MLPWTSGQPLGTSARPVASLEGNSIIISCHAPATPGCKGIRETQIEGRKIDSRSSSLWAQLNPQFSWPFAWSSWLLSHPGVCSRASSAHETEDTRVKRPRLHSSTSPGSRWTPSSPACAKVNKCNLHLAVPKRPVCRARRPSRSSTQTYLQPPHPTPPGSRLHFPFKSADLSQERWPAKVTFLK